MGIKHKAVKQSGERGYASEWNDDHIIDGDVDFGKFRIKNIVVDSGTVFPAGPVTGQLFYRADLGMLYFFDGTTWRTALYFSGKHTDLLNKEVNGVIDHADNSITTAKLRDGAVTEAKLADASVSTNKIKDLAVITGKLQNGAVTTEKISNLSVTEAKLANNSVSTNKIMDLAVTEAKIANGAVGVDKINNPYKCRVYRTTDYTIPANAIRTIPWEFEDFDPSNMFNVGVSATNIYINKSGYYLINLQTKFSGSNVYNWEGRILINGSAGWEVDANIWGNVYDGYDTYRSFNISVVKYLNAGEYVYARVDNDMSASLYLEDAYFEVILLL
jgi:hypothetical protein